MKTRHFVLLGLGILVGLATLLAARVFALPYRYQGSLIEPGVPAPDFLLVDQGGQTFRLSDYRGEVVLLFFGYTYCPDFCPTTLAEFKQVKSKLGVQAERVHFVMITVDPTRDTSERLQEYLANFDPAFTGLTGEQAALAPVWKSYGVYQSRADNNASSHASSGVDKTVDHSTYVYAIDTQGNLRLTYAFGIGSQALATDMAHLLKD